MVVQCDTTYPFLCPWNYALHSAAISSDALRKCWSLSVCCTDESWAIIRLSFVCLWDITSRAWVQGQTQWMGVVGVRMAPSAWPQLLHPARPTLIGWTLSARNRSWSTKLFWCERKHDFLCYTHLASRASSECRCFLTLATLILLTQTNCPTNWRRCWANRKEGGESQDEGDR